MNSRKSARIAKFLRKVYSLEIHLKQSATKQKEKDRFEALPNNAVITVASNDEIGRKRKSEKIQY